MAVRRGSTVGRQKIAIEKISKKTHLQVTFSKRRAGLFKKASELSTLCGVEIAILVFSPANKAFSFGNPDVESILGRFCAQHSFPGSGSRQLIQTHRNANVCDLNIQLTQILNQLDDEKAKGELLDQMRKSRQNMCWWESPIDQLGSQQLEQLKFALEELKKNVSDHVNKILMQSNNCSSFLFGNRIEHVAGYETKPDMASSIYYANNVGYPYGIL